MEVHGLIHYYIKNSLIIHKENTKEKHNRVVPLSVIKTRLLFSSSFFGKKNKTIFKLSTQINGFRGLFFEPFQKLAARVLSDLKHSAVACSFF